MDQKSWVHGNQDESKMFCFGRNNKLCKCRIHSQGMAMKDVDQLEDEKY